MSGNPNSILICGTVKSLGRKIRVGTIYQIYNKYKEEHFPRLLESLTVPPEDKSNIEPKTNNEDMLIIEIHQF